MKIFLIFEVALLPQRGDFFSGLLVSVRLAIRRPGFNPGSYQRLANMLHSVLKG